jgi:hypothetical protein
MMFFPLAKPPTYTKQTAEMRRDRTKFAQAGRQAAGAAGDF